MLTDKRRRRDSCPAGFYVVDIRTSATAGRVIAGAQLENWDVVLIELVVSTLYQKGGGGLLDAAAAAAVDDVDVGFGSCVRRQHFRAFCVLLISRCLQR